MALRHDRLRPSPTTTENHAKRRHARPVSGGILLFRWRKAYREGRLTLEDDAPFSFVPAVVMSDGERAQTTLAQPVVGRMEIVAHGGRRVIVGADVDATALARVLATLEGR